MNPDGYLLWGVTENEDENGNIYEDRETVLSFKSDDAGEIDMRISDADPLFSPESVLMIMHRIEEGNISDTGKRAWKQLKQELRDLDGKSGGGQQ